MKEAESTTTEDRTKRAQKKPGKGEKKKGNGKLKKAPFLRRAIPNNRPHQKTHNKEEWGP